MKWQEIIFFDLYAEPSRNGVYKSQEHHGQGVKIVNMGEIFAYGIISNQEMKRLEMNDSEIEKSGLIDGDLLFARRSLVESGAGKCSLVENLSEPTTFESSIIRVRLNYQLSRPKFYYYWFKSNKGRGSIQALVTGTNVKGIKGSDLKNIKVDYPPLNEQEKIVEILSKYDDLIQNNRRRIELLEESARLLYREWFVYLRFPGHEHTPIIDGIPEGWKNGTVGELAKVTSGFAFKSQDWEQEGNPVIKIKNIVGDGSINLTNCDCINDTIAEKASRFILSSGNLLIAMTGATVGKVGIMPNTDKKYYLNQRVGVFTTIKNIEYFLYPFFIDDFAQTQIKNYAGGAAQPNISSTQIESISLLIPDIFLLNIYIDNVTSYFQLRQNLIEQNEQLQQARDILLPRLMNGEIAV